MSIYCVTFTIADKTTGGKDYDARLRRLYANVDASSSAYWAETTSFILAASDMLTGAFATKACDGLSAEDDIVFIFDPSDMSAVCFGPVEHADVLKTFFPRLKKEG